MRILPLLFVLICSCSVYKTRNKVYNTNVNFMGGVYNTEKWSKSLIFQKNSWFQDATVQYEILITKMDRSSPFAKWMGSDILRLSQCNEFYIALVYANINAQGGTSVGGTSVLFSEFEKLGLDDVSLPEFSRQIRSHQNFNDWHLARHKVVGFCQKKSNIQQIFITLPGYESHKVL